MLTLSHNFFLSIPVFIFLFQPLPFYSLLDQPPHFRHQSHADNPVLLSYLWPTHPPYSTIFGSTALSFACLQINPYSKINLHVLLSGHLYLSQTSHFSNITESSSSSIVYICLLPLLALRHLSQPPLPRIRLLTSWHRSGRAHFCRCTVPTTTAQSCSSSACHPSLWHKSPFRMAQCS